MSTASDPELARVRDALLELLREGFGLDGRPRWLLARVERAVESLAERLGAPAEVLAHLNDHPDELRELAERLRVGETRFFRDPEQWQLLGEKVLPELLRAGPVRALSAGCSTGEEAWSLAMLLKRAATDRSASFSVLGADRSRAAVEAARAGVYPQLATRSMPAAFAKLYLEREGESVRVKDELFPLVRFVERELLKRPPLGKFQLVICKNLVIYLEPEARRRLFEWLLASLEPEGVLLVARSEISAARQAGGRIVELGAGVSVVRLG